MMRDSDPVELLHPAKRIEAVYSYDDRGERVDYREGVDWVFRGARLERTSQSKIPNFSTHRVNLNPDGRFSLASSPRNPPETITYNVYIDYATDLADRVIVARPVRAQIRSLKCLGDSITAGAHTIQRHYFDNDSQTWCALLRRQLGIPGDNQGVPGTSIGADIDAIISDNPDVVILAFGMNDHTAGAANLPMFRQLLDRAVRSVLARNASPILVGFFQRNTLFELEDRQQTIAYNDAIRDVASAHNVPFVDIAPSFVKAAVGTEPFYHLTADFLHHPNIYGQRLYFSALLPYVLASDTKASLIPDYVVLE